jgi:hypothetical protein
MLAKIDDLCAERDRLKAEQGGPNGPLHLARSRSSQYLCGLPGMDGP